MKTLIISEEMLDSVYVPVNNSRFPRNIRNRDVDVGPFDKVWGGIYWEIMTKTGEIRETLKR